MYHDLKFSSFLRALGTVVLIKLSPINDVTHYYTLHYRHVIMTHYSPKIKSRDVIYGWPNTTEKSDNFERKMGAFL